MGEAKTYLGDGVYAAFDGFAITLTTENGIETTNEIFLEPEVFANLERWFAVRADMEAMRAAKEQS